jgi:LuxR family maltose regulon positive regulatory protein
VLDLHHTIGVKLCPNIELSIPLISSPLISGRNGGLLQRELAGPEVAGLLSQLAPFDVKLRPPDLRGRTIEREVLSNEVIDSMDVVILIAGAGYGKTTLLAQWVRSRVPWAWLTLHPEDNDPATLVAYLLRALQSAWALPAESVGRLSDPGASETSVLLPRLSRLIESIPGPGVLALDEINAIEDPQCLRILEAVLESAPEGLHVLLSGRTLPPLGLERLRTRRRMLDLDEDDLAFSFTESQALMERARLQIAPGRLRRIHQMAEGWPAGVYLMALASERSEVGPPDLALPVVPYVREQVLSGLDSATIEFLVRTSVLDVQDGPGCDALLGRDDSSAMLSWLSQSHLFVAPVEGSDGTYRYHPLLSEVLRSELERRFPREVPHLHARVSQHFAARHEREAAVRHALAGGDTTAAAEMLWSYVPFMLGIGKGDTVASWIRGLSDREYDANPAFAVARSLASSLSGNGRQARLWLSIARRHELDTPLPDGTPLRFQVKLIEALICDSGVEGMVSAAHDALAIDVGDSPFRCIPLHLAGVGIALAGDLRTAIPLLDEGIEIGVLYPAAAVSGLAQKAMIAIVEGDWIAARRFVQRGRELYEHYRLDNVPSQAPFPAVAAMVAAHDSDMALAAEYAASSRALVARMSEMAPWLSIETMLILGQVELRLGRQATAAQLAREARNALARLPDAVALDAHLQTLEGALGPGIRASEALSTAEIRVIAFLPTHLTFGQIAEELIVSVNTVRSHAKAIYRKLNVTSRGEAVDRAMVLGLLEA